MKIPAYTCTQRPINEHSVLIHNFKREQKPSTLCKKQRKGKIIYLFFLAGVLLCPDCGSPFSSGTWDISVRALPPPTGVIANYTFLSFFFFWSWNQIFPALFIRNRRRLRIMKKCEMDETPFSSALYFQRSPRALFIRHKRKLAHGWFNLSAGLWDF